MKILKLLFFILFALQGALAQNTGNCGETIFSSVKTDSGVIISSSVYNGGRTDDIAVLTKVSPQGVILWRTETQASQLYVGEQNIYYLSDNYLYLIIYTSEPYEDSKVRLKKIDPANGNVVWQSAEYNTVSLPHRNNLIDYGDNVLFCYQKAPIIGTNNGGLELMSFNKSNGTRSTIYSNTSAPNNNISWATINADSNGNLIYAMNFDTGINTGNEYTCIVRKINQLNFNSIIWEKKFRFHPFLPSLASTDVIIIDKSDDIYCLTEVGRGNSEREVSSMFKLDNATGNTIWSRNITSYTKISDYQVLGGKIYLSISGITGNLSQTSNFYLKKIDTDTGISDWETSISLTESSYALEGAKSFDIDCNGDLFVTGYRAGSNTDNNGSGVDNGVWASLKVNGQDGTEIANTTFSNVAEQNDTKSIGWLAYHFADGPLFIGDLQYGTDVRARSYAKTDNNLENIITSGYMCFIDSDNDTLADYYELGTATSGYVTTVDSDGDGLPNYLDNDDDGDTVLTRLEIPRGDTDGDGILNYLDIDDDGDTVLTRTEAPRGDTDRDGLPNYLDSDDDGDSVATIIEIALGDTDGDNVLNYLDNDDDGDSRMTITEIPFGDTDNDGILNYLDNDDDGDGLITLLEIQWGDTDLDGVPNYLDNDDDGDSVPSIVEIALGDSDGDTIPNYRDTDDDGDSVATLIEFAIGDTDGDGILNYLDNDDDGDGMLTIQEDANGDGDPTNDFNDPINAELADYLNVAVALKAVAYSAPVFTVFPNPVDEVINISLKNSTAVTAIEIYDVNGRLVLRRNGDTNTVNVKGLQTGSYVLTVNTDTAIYHAVIIKN